ncbi:MAG: hypothetical protein LIO70_03620 [Clostridiales bacterium]|nr:hypothetical protein [Clostridiales bacterium]
MYTCVKNGKTFQVKDSKAARLYEAAGYTVTDSEAKAKAKTKAKTAEAADTAAEP